MSRTSEPIGAVLTALSLMLLIIPWALGGAYTAPEEGAGDPHAAHGGIKWAEAKGKQNSPAKADPADSEE